MNVTALRAFRDNYIWALTNAGEAVVVDPGDARPVEDWLARTGLRLAAILLTHHHPDHVGGVPRLKAAFGARVFGPGRGDVAGLDVPLHEGDKAEPGPGFPTFRVMEIPGHTLDHIAYHGAGLLFCGDTLFSGGCGKLFEGTAEQMHRSLRRLAALPDETRVYAGHEYTAANLRFARAVLPADGELADALASAEEITENGGETLPSTVARERRINVFLRAGEAAVRDAASRRAGGVPLGNETEVFAALRQWKNDF